MKTLKGLADEFGLSDKQVDEALRLGPVIMKIGLERYEFNKPMEEYFRKKLQECKDDS